MCKEPTIFGKDRTLSVSDENSVSNFAHRVSHRKINPVLEGTVVTLTLSRGASYGYDQRIEVFGTDGLVSVTNPRETSTELLDSSGSHRPRLVHSFPQRFEQAFSNELDAFADTLLDGAPWPVTEEDCVEVQRVADAALESCERGEVVYLDRAAFAGGHGAETGIV